MLTKDDNWIEDSDILSIFPTFVWKIQSTPEFYEKVNTKILKALYQINPDLADIPLGDSWQSNQQLHKREEFIDLVPRILTTAKTVLRFLKVSYDAVEITGCWANINSTGASHAIHSHPNNFLSGVYYVQTQAGADTINFHDPRPQTGIIRPPITELTAQNTDQVVVNVSKGTLLMFPAYLCHSVSRNESDNLRINISFNLMFSLFAENLSEPLWGP
ncbi:MAG: 2OG-Fe(II) oxygenase family protein [Nitrosomonadaceae bacterium]